MNPFDYISLKRDAGQRKRMFKEIVMKFNVKLFCYGRRGRRKKQRKWNRKLTDGGLTGNRQNGVSLLSTRINRRGILVNTLVFFFI